MLEVDQVTFLLVPLTFSVLVCPVYIVILVLFSLTLAASTTSVEITIETHTNASAKLINKDFNFFKNLSSPNLKLFYSGEKYIISKMILTIYFSNTR